MEMNIFFLSVARDITNRHLDSEAIEKHEKKLWFVLNETSDGLCDWSQSNGTVHFSPQLKSMLEYGPDEMSPNLSSWPYNIHPDDSQHVIHAITDHRT